MLFAHFLHLFCVVYCVIIGVFYIWLSRPISAMTLPYPLLVCYICLASLPGDVAIPSAVTSLNPLLVNFISLFGLFTRRRGQNLSVLVRLPRWSISAVTSHILCFSSSVCLAYLPGDVAITWVPSVRVLP